jgi:alpha-beta hydrolase superfamily lysophospholipase
MGEVENMSVKHTSDQFMGAGERLHLQSWLPAAADPEQPREPAAAIALVHGYGDHGGRHTWFGEDMAARGYAVYAYDLRGHGQSSGTRGQIKRFDDYLDDTAVFLDEVRRRQPGRPVVLLGHSLGGLICSRFAQERPCDVRALILSSPFFALTVQPEPMKIVGAKALSAVWPGRDIGNTVRAADLSHDQAVVDAYVTDRLVHHVATARWAAETLAAQDAAMAAAPRVTLPLLLLYGKDDQVADPAFAEAFFATAGSADKKLIHYEGFYHELFNEVGREQVFADVAAWLAERLPAGAGASPEPPAAGSAGDQAWPAPRFSRAPGAAGWSACLPACRRCSCR